MNYLEIRWQAGSTYFKVVHQRSEEHTSELQSRLHLVCRLLLEKKKKKPPTASSAPSPTPTHPGSSAASPCASRTTSPYSPAPRRPHRTRRVVPLPQP